MLTLVELAACCAEVVQLQPCSLPTVSSHAERVASNPVAAVTDTNNSRNSSAAELAAKALQTANQRDAVTAAIDQVAGVLVVQSRSSLLPAELKGDTHSGP